MRVVADTNVVVSGLLWRGNPRRVLDAARDGIIELYTSAALLEELEAVLSREKFATRLEAANLTVHELVVGYAALATVIEADAIEPVILADPDDDTVLACALAAQCEVIASGDSHLLDLKQYQGIRIVTATELLAELSL
ncbi:MAG TPA: putative toxin-antitoxin system toxin component, PIN family [Blastocatellia bacterium]|nr:putative toxin-antitoxin system toxin component, PIN family [Blastocatellia bacterium]